MLTLPTPGSDRVGRSSRVSASPSPPSSRPCGARRPGAAGGRDRRYPPDGLERPVACRGAGAGLRLEASRRRLLEAGDEQRRDLERRLHGAPRAASATSAVSFATGGNRRAGGCRGPGRRRETQLSESLEELGRLARGLHQDPVRDGLEGALVSLVETFPAPFGPGPRWPSRCRHGARHVLRLLRDPHERRQARLGTRAAVSVTTSDRVITVVVEDDGVGEAPPAAGRSRGLADRVETLGGTLQVDSVPGGGTRLTAEVPLGGEASCAPLSRSSSRSSSS